MGDGWDGANHRMIRPQRICPPDRVSFLMSDNTPIEVHSVPLGRDPFLYARELLHRQLIRAVQPPRCLIEQGGQRQILTAMEIEARVAGAR